MTILQDRREAGLKLAAKLEKYRAMHPLILGMPRGGVVVAFEIASALHAELDVIVARKIGAPGQPEYAIGAIAPGGIVVWNEEARGYFNFESAEAKSLVAKEEKEMERRLRYYRGADAPPLAAQGRIVIIADDGIATGQSALAAIRSVRALQPAKLILAVGVTSAEALSMLRSEVDEIICLAIPEPFWAVGSWYENFSQTEDNEVVELLRRNREEMQSFASKQNEK